MYQTISWPTSVARQPAEKYRKVTGIDLVAKMENLNDKKDNIPYSEIA